MAKRIVLLSAKRDLTRSQFIAALVRNGFRQRLLWYYDTTGVCPAVGFGGLLNRDGSPDRRATLAWIIQQRERHAAKRQEVE